MSNFSIIETHPKSMILQVFKIYTCNKTLDEKSAIFAPFKNKGIFVYSYHKLYK